MRPRINCQPEFYFQRSNLKLTNAYDEKYEAVSGILNENLPDCEFWKRQNRDIAVNLPNGGKGRVTIWKMQG